MFKRVPICGQTRTHAENTWVLVLKLLWYSIAEVQCSPCVLQRRTIYLKLFKEKLAIFFCQIIKCVVKFMSKNHLSAPLKQTYLYTINNTMFKSAAYSYTQINILSFIISFSLLNCKRWPSTIRWNAIAWTGYI